MSSVDKFGRSEKHDDKAPRILPRDPNCLHLDTDGNYTASNKRIKFLLDPLEAEDAITRGWAERHFLDKSTLAESANTYEFSFKRLSNVGEPREASDAITKKWFDEAHAKLKSELKYSADTQTGGAHETLDTKIDTLKGEIKSIRALIDVLATKGSAQSNASSNFPAKDKSEQNTKKTEKAATSDRGKKPETKKPLQ